MDFISANKATGYIVELTKVLLRSIDWTGQMSIKQSFSQLQALRKHGRGPYALGREQLDAYVDDKSGSLGAGDISVSELDHFVRALSHDMKANLMIVDHIFGRLKKQISLRGDSEMAETAEHLDLCLNQSRSLLDDLVTLGRTGHVDMKPAEVSLSTVAADVIENQKDLLAQRAIQVEIVEPMPVVWCNESRVRQVITNLIRNAAKHGCDSQDPRIRVSAAPISPEAVEKAFGSAGKNSISSELSWIALRINDNGPGIPEEYRTRIFDPGWRLPGTSSDGTGFGLAIVDKIARAYAGAAWVESGESVSGTEFVVLLPAALFAAVDGPHTAQQPHLRFKASGGAEPPPLPSTPAVETFVFDTLDVNTIIIDQPTISGDAHVHFH